MGSPVDRVDLTVSLMRLGLRGLSVTAGVKNAFDATVRYVLTPPTGPQVFVHAPRSWWVRLGYEL